MSNQPHSPLIRRCDVAVVGGSAAGLAAALQLQRQRRSVIVLDSGQPRNAPAAHMHGYLGYDAAPPAKLTETGRAEVRSYGGEVLHGDVTAVRGAANDFVVSAGHVEVHARRVIVATGVLDLLPDMDGIREHWGSSVIHCPFCHGYEARDLEMVQLVTHPLGLHPARLFAHLAGGLTLVIGPTVDVDTNEVAGLEATGASVVIGEADRVVESDGRLTGVELIDGRHLPCDVVAVTPRIQPRVAAFAELGVESVLHHTGIGEIVSTGPTGETSVEGVYAAGNVTDPSHQVINAAADGSRVGAMVALDLASVHEDASPPQPSEWDERYSGDELWSGRPNGTLVSEVAGMSPGRALDIGAGEGGDAVWLAEHGWTVTATDVARTGLERLAAKAAESGADVVCIHADANDPSPYEDGAFDLVSLFYSAIPRTGDDRGPNNIVSAVAPGGTLLVVGHAPPDPADAADHPSAWDRTSFVSIDHIRTAVASRPGWTVVTDEVRSRPVGSSTHHHHDHDVVFRAERTGTTTG